jgi:Secretion system C-terminal sorting domain
MLKKLLFSLTLLAMSNGVFAQISSFPATESFETAFLEGTDVAFIPNWTANFVNPPTTPSKIFQDFTDFNAGAAALSATPTSAFSGDIRVRLNLLTSQSMAVSFFAKSKLNGAGTRDVVIKMDASIDNGVTWIGSQTVASLPNVDQAAFTSYSYSLPVETNNQSNVIVRFSVLRGTTGTSTAARLVMDSVTIQQSSVPQVVVSETAFAFSQVLGTPSPTQTFNVSGVNLTGNININATTDYEVSLSPTTGFSNSLTINAANGSVASTPVYVRLNKATAGASTGTITISSASVANKTIALTGNTSAITLTNPTPLAVNAGTQTIFNQWPATSAAGTTPANTVIWTHNVADPDLTTVFVQNWNCLYNLTARSRFTGEEANGIGFINTGNSQFTGVCDGSDPLQATGNVIENGKAGAIVLALNTTNIPANGGINVNWTGRTILKNARIYGLRLQYRIGNGAGNPNADWTEFSQTQEYLSGEDATFQTFTTALPTTCLGKALVQVRWVYYFISGTGTRPSMALDDVSLSSVTLGTTNFDANQNKFSFYPNPVNGSTIRFNVASDITISDVSGKQVLSAKNATELNVSQLNAGIYFIRNAEGKVLKMIK